MFLVFIS